MFYEKVNILLIKEMNISKIFTKLEIQSSIVIPAIKDHRTSIIIQAINVPMEVKFD